MKMKIQNPRIMGCVEPRLKLRVMTLKESVGELKGRDKESFQLSRIGTFKV